MRYLKGIGVKVNRVIAPMSINIMIFIDPNPYIPIPGSYFATGTCFAVAGSIVKSVTLTQPVIGLASRI